MYCKNCGKDLPDNARFCDKCNMSVRKKERKMDMIEELKEERLARQKAHEIEARLKKIKKVKRKRYKNIALVIVGIVAVWGIIVGISYITNMSMESRLKGDNEEFNTPPPATRTVAPTKEPQNEAYATLVVQGIEFAYPKSFDKTEVEDGDCVASFSDGTATIVFDEQETSEIAKDLMDAYVESIPNADPGRGDSMANDNGYEITFPAGTKIYHKKCIIKDGIAISYEIKFPVDSAEQYEKHIEYMDEKLTVS